MLGESVRCMLDLMCGLANGVLEHERSWPQANRDISRITQRSWLLAVAGPSAFAICAKTLRGQVLRSEP